MSVKQRRRNKILHSQVKQTLKELKHKYLYGGRVPKDVEQTLKLAELLFYSGVR